MLTVRSLLVLGLLWAVEAAPQNRGGRGGRNGGGQTAQTAQDQAAQIPQGISQATDGSTIVDTTATINGLDIRFKISGPADQFTTASGVDGATQVAGAQGANGLNVLLHGDGGQSFFDMPNQAVQGNLMGVAVLAPDPNLFWGGGSGLDRTDGVAHAQAVNDLITDVLPQMMAFNSSNVFFTGVSGGSLLLSGFFVPAHMTNFKGNGVMLNCGALTPQVNFVDADAVMASTRIHYQSTQQELTLLQPAIPEAIQTYEQAATAAGLSVAQIGQLQTVDNTPNSGHCEFDGADFVNGVQLMANSYAAIMQGGNGRVDGIGSVLNPVPGNENLQFAAANKRGMDMKLKI
ncbi:uncharacterized protein BCR38DRAFT_338502 [Pseudomassariella vexata]|uniref:Cyclin-like F-box n=1 Tax=Pseudomassariella vexata TaxID=1141098 RepID=A0A1Y2E7A3_9PEZI|nr:uncharacterized protein BCR38DRAFT_338502 [Pseudomassariella vexata]ORY67317.1 hypothetical protein BCR38DRAFT_338502 [Pseudomassariella vexata]